METFSEALQARRKAAGLSLRALARAAHVDPGHLSRVESGNRPPTEAIAEAVDQVLDADGALVALADRATARTWTLTGDAWRRGDAEALAAVLVGETPSAA